MGKTQKSESKSTKSAKRSAWYVTANRNTNLPDGTFVAEGKKVKVTKEYVDRLRESNDKSFTITQE